MFRSSFYDHLQCYIEYFNRRKCRFTPYPRPHVSSVALTAGFAFRLAFANFLSPLSSILGQPTDLVDRVSILERPFADRFRSANGETKVCHGSIRSEKPSKVDRSPERPLVGSSRTRWTIDGFDRPGPDGPSLSEAREVRTRFPDLPARFPIDLDPLALIPLSFSRSVRAGIPRAKAKSTVRRFCWCLHWQFVSRDVERILEEGRKRCRRIIVEEERRLSLSHACPKRNGVPVRVGWFFLSTSKHATTNGKRSLTHGLRRAEQVSRHLKSENDECREYLDDA